MTNLFILLRKKTSIFVILGAATLAVFAFFLKLETENFSNRHTKSGRIKPYDDNPYYWQYKGVPVLLLGGTKEDNLFQLSDLEKHLDLLVNSGGNYVRNTMNSRDKGSLWPFHQRTDGKYDLDKLNKAYFERLETLLRLTFVRDIIVQIELWDRFDFSHDSWLRNPYRPENNVNYTPEQTGLANEYSRHPSLNDNAFFRSVPAHDNNTLLLKYQQAQVQRTLAISFKYPNVLYCVDNESSATAAWGAYWSEYIIRKAAEAGVEVHTTEMWEVWDLKHVQHRHTLDHPENYSYVDISQNNHNSGDQHWANLQWAKRYLAVQPRPLNNVKIYGAHNGRYGEEQEALERFWRNFIGGASSVRFHRPPLGIGLSKKAQGNIRSARLLLSEFDIFRAVPDVDSHLTTERHDNEAYLSYIAGEQYAVYFPNMGAVKLDLRESEGVFSMNWLNITKSEWQDSALIWGGRMVDLAPPAPGHWVVLLHRESGD